ncbi:MAG: DUF5063 domain-containing protein [Bacteroidales bacterium]
MEFFEDDPVNARKVLDMLTVANEFCLFVESVDKYKFTDVVEYLLKISPLLYLKGSLLPLVTPGNDGIADRYVTEEQWEGIFNSLKQVFSKDDVYAASFFTENNDNETNQFSLAENYADVYQDLKDFVMVYQKRTYTSRENAVSVCYQLFAGHWGPRILESLPRLHQLVYINKTDQELRNKEENDYL